jgi:hypothetical protein
MLLDRSMYKKVIFWLIFFTVILVLTMLDPTQAKGGKTKNSQHGRGETLRGLLDRIQIALGVTNKGRHYWQNSIQKW